MQRDARGDAQPRAADEEPLSFREECERLGIELLSPEEYGSSAVVWFFGSPRPSTDDESGPPEAKGSSSDSQ